MKKEKSSQKLKKEYQFFLESPPSRPSIDVTSFIKKTLNEDLNPRAFKVFSKLFAIHFISGAITLFFCPQLGVPFHQETSFLLKLFKGFGEYGCMVACGALFLGGTGLVAAFLLRSQEVRVIKKTRALQWALLSFFSVGFFLAVREAETAIPLSLLSTWVFGALFGGFVSFQLAWRARWRIHQYLLR